MDWNTLLFASKWAIIGLIYFVLFILLLGVYREMAPRVERSRQAAPLVYGRLRVIHSGNDPRTRAGAIFNLNPETRLGSAPDNDIVLADRYVSGHHARLRWDGAVWHVEDLNSKNGTFVNRQPCVPGLPHPLPDGSRLDLGDMSFELLE